MKSTTKASAKKTVKKETKAPMKKMGAKSKSC